MGRGKERLLLGVALWIGLQRFLQSAPQLEMIVTVTEANGVVVSTHPCLSLASPTLQGGVFFTALLGVQRLLWVFSLSGAEIMLLLRKSVCLCLLPHASGPLFLVCVPGQLHSGRTEDLDLG